MPHFHPATGLNGMATGLFGKLPAHGDFVRRHLPRSFTDPWDAWLSAGIAQARAALGDDWDAAWEAAPVWRFRLSPGACGPEAVVGVIATPSDLVGRQFPLTLAAILPGAATPPPDAWYARLEAAALLARRDGLHADALAAALPPAPDDDPDATLDGRSLFWSATAPARGMADLAGFVTLLAWPARDGFATEARPGCVVALDSPAQLTNPFEAPLAERPPATAAALHHPGQCAELAAAPVSGQPAVSTGRLPAPLDAAPPGTDRASLPPEDRETLTAEPRAHPRAVPRDDAAGDDRAAAEMLAIVTGTRLSEADVFTPPTTDAAP